MTHHGVIVLASLAVFGATLSLSAQRTPPTASLVRAEGVVTLNGQPVPAGGSAVTLDNVAELQTKEQASLAR